ncbi:hypothetical protein [Parageobacillus sp. G301]|uniref:hypothetical protein n=1 Tax=Parageobacillus sp. G301 TaxID=2998290 RepID=UPI002499577D|nr:hypothetical protein [Parageobacillus sp. G301]GLH62407.1 hypothetical protein PG301_02470 [Parageobacillus sp. G301]
MKGVIPIGFFDFFKSFKNTVSSEVETVSLQKKHVQSSREPAKSPRELSIEYYSKARKAFDNGDINEAVRLLEESNRHLVASFAKNEEEVQKALKFFFTVDREGYDAAKQIKIPIHNISKEELNQIQNELCWYVLNGYKPDYVLMAFLMFKEYKWKEFDEEFKRVKENPNEKYGLYYFVKNEPKQPQDLSRYREEFYNLSLDARILLTSYNAIGRKRKIKIEDFPYLENQKGYEEIKIYIQRSSNEVILEFPVETPMERKQVMWEKKKLEALMYYLQALVYRKKSYQEAKKRFEDGEGFFLINGQGGSTKCRAEVLSVRSSKEKDLPPHSVGCKCLIHKVLRLDRLSEAERKKYQI